MHQVAAAQVGHLEVDVAEVQARQVGAAEVEALKSRGGGKRGEIPACKHGERGESLTVPDSGVLTLWAWPEESAPTLYGKWGSGPRGAASSGHNIHRVRLDTF